MRATAAIQTKVCGLNDLKNARAVRDSGADFIGFIFHDASPRNCTLSSKSVKRMASKGAKKVGVFVNRKEQFVLQKMADYGLDFAQLHGDESIEFCKNIQKSGTKIIKVFSVNDEFDLSVTDNYQFCNFLLFDTKGRDRGGNGEKFNWTILNNYRGETPFFLSGGIAPKDAGSSSFVSEINSKLVAIDINSKFEIKPGLKDVELIKPIITSMKYARYGN